LAEIQSADRQCIHSGEHSTRNIKYLPKKAAQIFASNCSQLPPIGRSIWTSKVGKLGRLFALFALFALLLLDLQQLAATCINLQQTVAEKHLSSCATSFWRSCKSVASA